jgi:hypothetical protein
LKKFIQVEAEVLEVGAFTQLEPFQVSTSLNIGLSAETSASQLRVKDVTGNIFSNIEEQSVKVEADFFIIILHIKLHTHLIVFDTVGSCELRAEAIVEYSLFP